MIREAVREILIKEGFFDDILSGIKTGVGKTYDTIASAVGTEKPKSGFFKMLDDLVPDDDNTSQDLIPGVTTSSNVILTPETRDFITQLRNILDPDIPLHITSALRTPEEQASAMLEKFKASPEEFYRIYRRIAHKFEGVPLDVGSWTGVVTSMRDSGEFTSQHLLGKAIDIRTRNLSPDQVAQIVAAVEEAGGEPILEMNPPHLHVDKFQTRYAMSENISRRSHLRRRASYL